LFKHPARNAIYTRAFDKWEADYRGWDIVHSDTPVTLLDRAVLRGMVRANAQPFALARKAASRPSVDWDLNFTNPQAHSGGLAAQRTLAYDLGFAVLLEHSSGHDAAAIEYVIDMLAQASALYRSRGHLVWNQVAVGIDAMAGRRLETIAPQLKISDPNDRTPAAGAASATRIQWLIDKLLDSNESSQSARCAWQFERLTSLDDRFFLSRGFVVPRELWWLRPMSRLDHLRLSRFAGTAADALRAESYPRVAASLPVEDNRESTPPAYQMTRTRSSVLRPPARRYAENHFRVIAIHRTTATMLALRLFAVDHDGRLPRTLDELVPRYLPSVPTDPFDPAGRSIRYRPDASPPTLYSVGVDGIDDGGLSPPNTTPRKNGDWVVHYRR
jgi:hypothetical protein